MLQPPPVREALQQQPSGRPPLGKKMDRDNILVTSMPKAGTHLLSKIIACIFGRPALSLKKSALSTLPSVNRVVDELGYRDFLFHGHFRYHHFSPLLTSWHWKVIVLVRDPRDVILSLRDFLATSQDPILVDAYATIRDLPYRDQIKALVRGIKTPRFEVARLESYCRGWVEWQRRRAIVLKYEELASDETAAKLAEFLDLPLPQIVAAVRKGYGADNPTKRIGKADRWREVLDEDLCEFFRQEDGGAIAHLGYNWDPVAGDPAQHATDDADGIAVANPAERDGGLSADGQPGEVDDDAPRAPPAGEGTVATEAPVPLPALGPAAH
jgi:hypothetical protein